MQKQRENPTESVEARSGFEPLNKGFADLDPGSKSPIDSITRAGCCASLPGARPVPNHTPDNRYRIQKSVKPFQWWSPFPDPPPGWWLIWRGKVRVFDSWEAAVLGAYKHHALRSRMKDVRRSRRCAR